MKVRLAQGVTEMVRDNLSAYARSYINLEYQFEEKGGWGINWWPIVLRYDYENLVHHPIRIDFTNMAFNYTHMVSDGEAVLFLELPMIEDLTFEMDYTGAAGLLPFGGHMKAVIAKSTALMTLKMKATSHGVLYP